MKSISNSLDKLSTNYIALHDLDGLINRLTSLLTSTIESRDRVLNGFCPCLSFIFPAFDNLRLFISDSDMGAIALVSKSLYQLIIAKYTDYQTQIYILKHYIDSYNYDVDIDFVVDNQKISVPISIRDISKRKLRILIGPESYFKIYKTIFFKNDVLYELGRIKAFHQNITTNSLVCIFCKNNKTIENDHKSCMIDNQICINNSGYILLVKCDKIYPELEYIAKNNNKNNMPEHMKNTCNGNYQPRLGYHKSHRFTELCCRCDLPYFIHLLCRK